MPLRMMDTAVWAVTVGTTLFFALYWTHMPDQVPIHWDGAGVIDDYAGAGGYIMLIIIMYFFLAWHVLSKIFLGLMGNENFFGKELSGKVTGDDRKSGARLFLYMLWWCDLIVEILIAYIIVCGAFVRNLGAWLLPAVFTGLAVDFIWYYVKMGRLKEKIRKRRIGQKTEFI